MGTWSIDNGASITQDGKVTIPISSTYKEYTVTYKSSDDGCTCYHTITQSAAPPVGCTFTVKSNVEGASVSWSNGDSGTIVGGSHSTTASSGSYRATLSKAGCTFSNNGALCSCDSSVTIDGSCGGGGCSSYNYTYASTANIGCEGGTSVSLAYTATCVDDASDWHTGETSATISKIDCNSSTSTQTYTRTWNGHSITITQAKGDCCSTPGCTCSLDLDDDLSAAGGTNVAVGTWSSTCSGSHGIMYVNGDNFLSSFRLGDDGKVYASFDRNDGGQKTATYALTGTGCYDNASAGQKGSSPGGDCNCSDFTINGNLQFGADTNLTRTTTYTPTSCTPSVESQPSWITNVTALNGIISATATANTGVYRNDYVYFKIDGTTCSNDPLGVAQYGASSPNTYSFEFEYYEDENGPDVYGDYILTTGYRITNFKINGQTASPSADVYYSLEYYSTNCTVTSRSNFTGGTSNSTTYNHNEGSTNCTGSKLHCSGFKVSYNGTVLEQKQAQDEGLNGTYSGTF